MIGNKGKNIIFAERKQIIQKDEPVIDFLFSVCEMAVLVEVADTIQQPVIAERHFVVIIWLVRLFLLQRRIASATVNAGEHMCR